MKQGRRGHTFIMVYCAVVALLALARPLLHSHPSPVTTHPSPVTTHPSPFTSHPSQKVHPILSVSDYDDCFPDSNHVQLMSAHRWGVSPVMDRSEAEARKNELVYMGCSPFYHVDPLHQSIPYLVPRAAILLQDIGRAFYDSLHVKGLPLQLFVVTSVLRTRADVERLRRFNGNATENSCHLFGTTFDISYTRYFPLHLPGEPQRREVRDDTLKYILSEVLRDARQTGRCYVKYEKKQKCFHITVR